MDQYNKEKIKAIKKTNTWQLMIFQQKKVIEVKWVFKTKKKSNNKVKRYKARLVSKGYEQ